MSSANNSDHLIVTKNVGNVQTPLIRMVISNKQQRKTTSN